MSTIVIPYPIGGGGAGDNFFAGVSAGAENIAVPEAETPVIGFDFNWMVLQSATVEEYI